MILTGLMACDNVTWGGVEVRLEAPPAADTAALATADTLPGAEPELPPLDLGPSLFLVDRTGPSTGASGSTARLLPVAVLGSDGLQPFPAPDQAERLGERFIRERMAPGRRFVLYARGARVGAFFPDSAGSTVDFGATVEEGPTAPGPSPLQARAPLCTPRPAVTGWIELLPEAAEEERLIALPEGSEVLLGHAGYEPPTTTRDQRVAALNVASALYVTQEILWPPSVVEARRDMHVFQLPGSAEELIAATFLYGDSLAVGPAPPNAYSLFFIARPGAAGRYEASYVRYRELGPDGKSAPRWINHVDWNGDGREDVLLEVFGETGRSFAALTRSDTGWVQVFEEECPAPSPTVAFRTGSGAETSAPDG